MSRDVEDGVRAFIRSGRVDPSRVAFVGASYVAYASLTAAMQSPDLVRCAAGIGGVYDLSRFVAGRLRGTEKHGETADFWTKTIGSLSTDRAAPIERSPARNADRIKAPVLLIHGAEDSVVDVSQSAAMRDALVRAGAPPTYSILEGDDHWLSSSETRTRMLDELDRFLTRWLRG
jgi:dipeptidyl aminopeptidase/acylaminoacyl peptidase